MRQLGRHCIVPMQRFVQREVLDRLASGPPAT
jgi:hypothetical protein